MGTNDVDVVIEHILESQNNLNLALDVSFAYREVRRRLIVRCLEELERAMRESLDPAAWEIENSLRAKLFQSWQGFYTVKHDWKGHYKIGLSAGKPDARGFIIGVDRGEEGLSAVEGLKGALDASIRHGLASPRWEWYHSLEYPYSDWDNKEVLMSMYDGSAARYLSAYLVRIASEASPCIDRYLSATR